MTKLHLLPPEELAELLGLACKRFGVDLIGRCSRETVSPLVLATAMHLTNDPPEAEE